MLIAVHITKYVVALVGEGLRVSCIIAFRRVLPFAAGAHGMRICIKRKKIHYGKFFDFCAEKCVYN